MRGSPTGAFLDGPESLVRFLPRMKERGYAVTNLPQTSEELIARMRASGHNLAPWMQGELEEMVDSGQTVLIPLSRYRQWFDQKLSPSNRQAVINAFGPPPGRIMVVQRNGQPCIVIPRIDLGNVVLLPQPERGETMDEKLLHSRDVPPPHNYLAFYWWLQEDEKADALVHWGTHGSLELLPGKEAGLTRDCWSDICAGDLPVVDLWIMDNLGEATLSRRRSYALLVDHMVPPTIRAGAADRYVALHDELDKYDALETGLLKNQYLKLVSTQVQEEKLDRELGIHMTNGLLSPNDLQRVAEHIDFLFEARTPMTLHVLGQPPAQQSLVPYLISILGRSFIKDLAKALPAVPRFDSESQNRLWLEQKGEELLRSSFSNQSPEGITVTPELQKDLDFAREMTNRLGQADHEITGLLRGLEGKYITPGPGPEPIRNPSSVPGGRNLYALNPEEIPTRPAWEVAVQLVDEMLKTRHPKKVGLDLNGMDTMRDFGVMEGQILYLMGVRPVWDRNNLARDVEVIPQNELKRPRIDVFVAMGGLYKENFPTRAALIDKAIRLASEIQETNNYVREGTRATASRLVASGMPPEQAAQLASARIFGAKPGDLAGTKILYLVPRSGVWEKDDDVADVYIDSMSYVYTKGAWGQKVQGLYEQAIQGTDLLIRVWASSMTSQLSNHHAYEYLGGLSMAVKKLTGKEPQALIADVRDPSGAKMRDFQEVLLTSLKTELLNQKWVEGMKEHGYAGAGHTAELVKNTFGWSVTRPGSVSDAAWNDVYEVYVQDKYYLGLRQWFEKENPHALAEITATLMEASRTGHWNAPPEALRSLAEAYAKLVSRFGESGGLVSGGNKKLDEFVTKQLTAPGDSAGADLAARFTEVLAKAVGQAAPAKTVEGQKLEVTSQTAPAAAATPAAVPYVRVVPVLAVVLIGLGFVHKRGTL
jgi:cobaltochelatase CobN